MVSELNLCGIFFSLNQHASRDATILTTFFFSSMTVVWLLSKCSFFSNELHFPISSGLLAYLMSAEGIIIANAFTSPQRSSLFLSELSHAVAWKSSVHSSESVHSKQSSHTHVAVGMSDSF